MTNFLTAILLATITNTSAPKIVGNHPSGQVREYQHAVVENWELRAGDRKICNAQNVVTNWFSLEIVPTNSVLRVDPSVKAATAIKSATSTPSQRIAGPSTRPAPNIKQPNK